MRGRWLVVGAWSLAVVAGGLRAQAPAQQPPPRPVSGAPIELPPMLVEESVSGVPWYYVNVGGTEYLSRCSASTTRQFVEAVLAKHQLMRVLVPEEFLAHLDVSAVCVLYSQDLEHTVSAEIQRELQGDDRGKKDAPGSEGRVNIAPNMRLVDRDMHATIVYIDEALFDASTLSLAPGHVRFLMTRRVPELPAWLVEGFERTYSRADFVMSPITLGPLVWNTRGESDALSWDATRPRAVLPAVELFANGALRGAESRHARRLESRASTQELFVRWAITNSPATRDTFWKFAARATEGNVTEELFEAMFGFDFAELRDRLSDYLPDAVEQTKKINPGDLPDLPSFEVDRATPNQIARVRGEWERLAIGHVQRRAPQVREPYLAQARRTLRRAFDGGDRDPRLLATMGLCEVDAGNDAGARQFLEPAVAAGVVRPRAYHELARLRFDELRRGVPDTKVFSYGELAPVIDPLRRAVTQAPPLPEVFALLGEAWSRCELAPNTADLAELELGARLFARRPNVAYSLARALARHGKASEATALLDGCAGYSTDEDTRAGIARLRAEVAGTPTGRRSGEQ